MPQGFVFSSRIRCSPRPSTSRSVIIHIHGHRVAGERRFGRHAGDTNPPIDVPAERVDNGNYVKQTRTSQAGIAPQPQHRNPFPLVGDFDRKQQVNAGRQSGGKWGPVADGGRDPQTCHNASATATPLTRFLLRWSHMTRHLLFLPPFVLSASSRSISSSTLYPADPARPTNSSRSWVNWRWRSGSSRFTFAG